MRPHPSYQWLLVVTSLLSALSTVSSASLRTSSSTPQNNNKPKLASFRLIPGDSPEARRRRRQRHRQRRLLGESTNGEEEEEETPLLMEPQEEEENPLELHRDQLYEGYGVHYVDLWVGCPTPQRVTVIVDTGSSVTGFPCTPCHHCGGDADSADEHVLYHTDTLFRQEESTCFEIVGDAKECMVGEWHKDTSSCRASKHYSEGSSWDAFEAVDLVYTGGDHNGVDMSREEKESFKLHFGCQDSVTGLFETQLADGIMGLYNNPASFWYQMYAEKKLEQQAFSLCFSEPGHVERTGTQAGAMVLGGTDTRLHKTKMVHARQMTQNGKYVVHLEKVFLLEPSTETPREVKPEGIHKVQIFEEDLNNRGPVILDSGTTATYLTQQLERRFVAVFNEMVPEDLMVLQTHQEYTLTQRELQQLPTIVFQMTAAEELDEEVETTSVPGFVGSDIDPKHAGKSILVAMPPSHYMTRVVDDDEVVDLSDLDEPGHYKFTVYFSKRKGKGGVLGANFMKGHDVLFDIDNSRIGFAQSDCEYSVLADDEEAG